MFLSGEKAIKKVQIVILYSVSSVIDNYFMSPDMFDQS